MYRRVCYFVYLRLIGSYFGTVDRVRAFLIREMTGNRVDCLQVRAGVYISGYRNLVIGSNVSINHNCHLSCEGGLTIGDDVSIGHSVSILTTEHTYSNSDLPIKTQPISCHRVVISDDVWIGANATILAGVELAKGTVVAAGAVVKKSVRTENSIVGGVPACHIRGRFDS